MIRMIALGALMSSSLLANAHGSVEGGIKYTLKAKGNYPSVMKYLQSKGHDVLGVDIPNSLIDIIVTKEDALEISKLDVELTKDTMTSLKRGLDQRYLNPSEIERFLKETNEKYPSITKLIKVGQSLEGRDIMAIKISDSPQVDDPSEPSLLYNGMHHAREIMTPEVTTDIVSYLVTNYKSDPKVKSWVDNNEIYVLPMLNVDGNTKVWEGSKMWRKNTRGGYGVDINRNYPTNWGACSGSSGWRSSQQYRGSQAASEPETKVLMDFVSTIKPVFNISYHAYSELVIYPYGCKGQRTANKEVVEGIGKEIGKILNYVPGTSWETLYSVDGSDIDWMYEAEQVIPYVIEVSPRSDGFQPPYEKRDAEVAKNRAGWQHLLQRMDGPSIHGITKAHSVITIEKADKSGFTKYQDYKVNPDGSYHIILQEGEYRLNFVGENSITKTLKVDKRIQL